MKCIAVIGAGFGDEGKGRVTDYLCSLYQKPLVIRFSGGHQAGHNVQLDNKLNHVFSNFGCGTLRGCHTYWSEYCTVDPQGIIKEDKVLRDKGYSGTLFINKECPITTPYDKLFNIKQNKKTKHGTCGVGFGATWQREEDRVSLKFKDLFDSVIFKIKLNLIGEYYNSKVERNPIEIGQFVRYCVEIRDKSNIYMVDNIPFNFYDAYIFEGSQGLLLDQDIGFFPHVTRSNTGLKNIIKMGYTPEVFLVTRAYQTRHGNGPMTNEDINHNIKENPYEQNYSMGFQGVFRETILDLNLLKYGIENEKDLRHKQKNLVITCLDLVDNYKYTLNGKIETCKNEKEFVREIQRILKIEDIYLSRCAFGSIDKFDYYK